MLTLNGIRAFNEGDRILAGLFLQGSVTIDRDVLVRLFGNPAVNMGRGEASREWALHFLLPDEMIVEATISPAVLARNGANLMPVHWHVGGRQKLALSLVQKFINHAVQNPE